VIVATYRCLAFAALVPGQPANRNSLSVARILPYPTLAALTTWTVTIAASGPTADQSWHGRPAPALEMLRSNSSTWVNCGYG